jgi:hypothetical protein
VLGEVDDPVYKVSAVKPLTEARVVSRQVLHACCCNELTCCSSLMHRMASVPYTWFPSMATLT